MLAASHPLHPWSETGSARWQVQVWGCAPTVNVSWLLQSSACNYPDPPRAPTTQGPDIDPCIYDASDIGEGGNCRIVALFGSARHGHLLSGLTPGVNLQTGVWQHLAGLDLQAHAFCCKPEMSAVKLGLNRCLPTEKQSLQDSLQSTIPWSFVVWLHAPQRAGCV